MLYFALLATISEVPDTTEPLPLVFFHVQEMSLGSFFSKSSFYENSIMRMADRHEQDLEISRGFMLISYTEILSMFSRK